MESYGGENLWYFSKTAYSKIKQECNPFWQDVITSWAALSENQPTAPIHPEDILSQPLFLNDNIKIDGKMVYLKKWIKNGVFFSNDLVDENGNLYSFHDFIRIFRINTNFLEFCGILNALPQAWKNILNSQNSKKLESVVQGNINAMKKVDKVPRHFYKYLIEKIKEKPINIQEKWSQKIHAELLDEDWEFFLVYLYL